MATRTTPENCAPSAEARRGTAYRTPVVPADEPTAAVYAVYPHVAYNGGRKSTPYLRVVSSAQLGDTTVFPCDRDGEFLAFELLACVQVENHRAALRNVGAGYDLEVVPCVRA